MKKIILLFLIFATMQAKAQIIAERSSPGAGLSLGFELGLPSQSIYNVGVGVSAKAEIPVQGSVNLALTAGYSSFFFKSALIGASSMPSAAGYVPLKAGIKYYLGPSFYLEAEGGAVFETNYDKDVLSALAIGPGFLIPLKKSGRGIDVGLRYERWSKNFKQTGIRVAYRFGW